jgi:hypothetical protein
MTGCGTDGLIASGGTPNLTRDEQIEMNQSVLVQNF